MKQVNREELLDAGRASPQEVRRSLRDLRRINALPGGTSASVASVARVLNGKSPATILDVGAGSGDTTQALQNYARKHGLDWHVVGVDLKREHLQFARELGETLDSRKAATATAWPRSASLCSLWLQADAFRLPFANQSVDCVSASLLLHHFRGPQVQSLFQEFERVSRVGWICSDLVRARPPLLFFALMWPIFARSYLTRFDARASIRRAYTVEEMCKLAKSSAVADVSVQAQFAYRMNVAKRKS